MDRFCAMAGAGRLGGGALMAQFTRDELAVLYDALQCRIEQQRRRLDAPAGEELAATIARVAPEDAAYLRACRTALGKIAARIAPF